MHPNQTKTGSINPDDCKYLQAPPSELKTLEKDPSGPKEITIDY